MKRNLDGVYFRVKTEDGIYDNVCFSDLTDEQQNEMMNGRDETWLKSLCKILAKTIREIGDEFDIVMGYEDEN